MGVFHSFRQFFHRKPAAAPDCELCRDLVERIEALESSWRVLRLEWVDALDKLTSLHGRTLKRIRDGLGALAEDVPAPLDQRAARELAKREIRRRAYGLSGGGHRNADSGG
jgi:hypothetical protein